MFIVVLIKNTTSAVKYLWSKWLILLIAGICFGLLGILYAWMQKPSYVAELKFSSEAGGDNALGGYAGLAAQLGFDLGGGTGSAFEGDNLMELLKSWKIIEQTLLTESGYSPTHKLLLEEYVSNHEMNKAWAKDPKYSHIHFIKNPPPDRIRDSITKEIYKSIVLQQLSIDKVDKKLSFIVVKMKDVNELFAKEFVETLVDNATKYYVDYKSSKSRKNFQLINRLTDSVRHLLYGNIESYAASSDLNVNPLRQVVRTSGQKIQVNAQANTALYTELLKQLGLAQISLQKETPLVQIIDSPVLPLFNEKKGRLFMGIVFAFFGTSIIAFYLLIRSWIKRGIYLDTAATDRMSK